MPYGRQYRRDLGGFLQIPYVPTDEATERRLDLAIFSVRNALCGPHTLSQAPSGGRGSLLTALALTGVAQDHWVHKPSGVRVAGVLERQLVSNVPAFAGCPPNI